MKKNSIIKWIFTFVGSIFFLVGAFLTYQTNDFMNNAVATRGTVIAVETIYSNDGTTYKPTFSYIDANGKRYESETFISSSSYNFSRGTLVDIMYDRRDPSEMRIDSWFSLWGFGFVFMAVGVAPMVIGFFIGRAGRKKIPKVQRTNQRRVVSTEDDEHIRSREDDEYLHLDPNESAADHAREENYRPTVRRRR